MTTMGSRLRRRFLPNENGREFAFVVSPSVGAVRWKFGGPRSPVEHLPL
jgi:hypothetical protein